MQFTIPPEWRRWLYAVLAVLASTVTVIVAIDTDGDGTADHVITLSEREQKANDAADALNATLPGPLVALPNPSKPSEPLVTDTDQRLDATEKIENATREQGVNSDPAAAVGIHEDMRDETPPGVPLEKIEAGKEKTAELAEETLNEPIEPAGAQPYSCRPNYVVNRSALSGSRVGTALHFTVSPPGTLRMIFGLFNRSSFGASSNYGIELFADADGGCELWVPENQKAWAQGAANSAYVSIEIIANNPTRQEWLDSPIIKNGILAALVRDINLRHGAPLKLVDPQGCVWPAGITDHDRLECGNTHWDVGENFPWDVFMRQVRQGVKVTRLNAVERKLVAKRCHHYRQHVAAPDGSKVERRNLGWARHYRHRIREQKHKLATNRRQARDPWKRYHRGARYQELSRAETGKSCR